MEVYIPSFRYEESDLERGYTVFKIEVLMNGRKHFVEKRYSEFHALHKKLKKCIKTPEIPSKHVRNWVPKVLEQRRQGLETYLQLFLNLFLISVWGLENDALSGVRGLLCSFYTLWRQRFSPDCHLRLTALVHRHPFALLSLSSSFCPFIPSHSALGPAVILENEELPKLFLDFLNVRHLPSLPKAESCGSFDETESEESSKLSHQPVLLFLRDPYVLPAASDIFILGLKEGRSKLVNS
ncbi:sorting nexin-24 isoform X3 [Loxodonta africana]|uniref:sorting nexin-24 isoform X3 n=1 Tax=Loxodonta africana TaxID=9785 RepID=UPI0030CE2A44